MTWWAGYLAAIFVLIAWLGFAKVALVALGGALVVVSYLVVLFWFLNGGGPRGH